MKIILLAAVLAAAPACNKKQEESTKQPEGSAQVSKPGSAATPVETADYIDVSGEHKKRKDTDPVVVHFDRFKVTKATFDPAKIEGGTASIEVDLASLKTGSKQRDEHLKGPDYVDVGTLATMTIDVDNVKLSSGKSYTADANVKLHGAEKKYAVTFDVVDAKDDWIKIKGEHKFPRTDFKIGKDPADPDESVAAEITIKVALTLKKT
jgi:polyisoprenoid-binding protein YceI